MRAWKVPQVLQELAKGFVAFGQSAGFETDRLHDWDIFTDHLLFEVHRKIQKRLIGCVVAVRSPGSNNHVGGALPRPGQTKRSNEAEPTPVEDTTLVKDTGAKNTNTVLDGLATRMPSLEIVQHRVICPLDVSIWVRLIESNPV